MPSPCGRVQKVPTTLPKNLPKTAIPLPQERLDAFCQKWNVRSLSLFGSVLRNDFGVKSDVDILLDLADDPHRPWDYLFDMHQELKDVFGREVDIVERAWLQRSRNAVRREGILNSATAVYVQQ